MKEIRRFGNLGTVHEWENGERCYYKHVRRDNHFLRKYNAWAISVDIVTELQAMGVNHITLYVTEHNGGMHVLRTTLTNFMNHSFINKFRDYEEQYFLDEKYWEQTTVKQ